MRLKHYQEKVLKELKEYLVSLSEFNVKYEKALEFDADMAKDYNFPKRAYEQHSKDISKKTNWFGVVDCSVNTNLSSNYFSTQK